MTIVQLISFASGLMQLLLCGCTFAREIPHQAEHVNYPTAPAHQRVGWWVLGCLLGYIGVETLCLAWSGHRYSRPSGFLVTTAWLYVAAVDVDGVLRRWLPARLQARVQRFFYVASCKRAAQLRRERERNLKAVSRPLVDGAIISTPSPSAAGPALAELTLAGAIVVGPGEPPEALLPPSSAD